MLDTSVLIAGTDEGLELADDSAISVVTVGELQAGVELARAAHIRRARQVRLNRVREAFAPIPINEETAIAYGRLLAVARKSGRIQKATDLLIAATAAINGRTLWTRDQAQAPLADEAVIASRLV